MGEGEEATEEEICPIPCDSSAITASFPRNRKVQLPCEVPEVCTD